MSEPTLVQEAFATGEEIGPVVARIEDAIQDVPRTHALIALTSMLLLLQAPHISQEVIYEGVKDISRFVCMWLAGSDASSEESSDPAKMN